MSDMTKPETSFTVRDLNRHTAEVLSECDRTGRVLIRSRKGTTYELRPTEEKAAAKSKRATLAAAWEAAFERQKALHEKFGVKPMTKKQRDQLDRMIAGE